MADKATGNISASVMSDFAKKTMGGTLSYEPANTGDQWIYVETIIDAASVALIADGRQYAERYIRADEGTEKIADSADIVRWMGIKHTGTTDGSTATDSGIVISLDAAGNAAYGEVEGFFIDSGEFFCFKTPACTLATIGAISVTVTDGAPASPSSPGDVLVQVAAILDNVS